MTRLAPSNPAAHALLNLRAHTHGLQ
jgi:hypothetical protein